MRVARRLIATTGGRTLLVVALLMLCYQLYTAVQAPRRIDDDVAGGTDSRGQVDVRIELDFAPERFHILRVQEFGRVAGTEQRSMEVRAIDLEGVRTLARHHWVERIRLIEEETWEPSVDNDEDEEVPT